MKDSEFEKEMARRVGLFGKWFDQPNWWKDQLFRNPDADLIRSAMQYAFLAGFQGSAGVC